MLSLFNFTARRNRRTERALDVKIAAAVAAIDAEKARAAAALAIAERDLQDAIAQLDTLPEPFKASQRAVIRARQYLRDQLANLAA